MIMVIEMHDLFVLVDVMKHDQLVVGELTPARRISLRRVTQYSDTNEFMMTSSNGNVFHVNGPFLREFSFIWTWTNDWPNHQGVGDLRHHRAHYATTVSLGAIIIPPQRFITVPICTNSFMHKG